MGLDNTAPFGTAVSGAGVGVAKAKGGGGGGGGGGAAAADEKRAGGAGPAAALGMGGGAPVTAPAQAGAALAAAATLAGANNSLAGAGNLTPYRTEWSVFSEVSPSWCLAGTIDMAFAVGGDADRLVLFDWKRTREVRRCGGQWSAVTIRLTLTTDTDH
jgi:hypothetical protein